MANIPASDLMVALVQAASTLLAFAIARATLFGLCNSILALPPLLVRDQLAGGPLVYGVLLAGFSAGDLHRRTG
uniref:MFS transporter n=1 Tax=unclassified Mesorhizobium TaxID=325217 RepID=UPI00313B635D